MRGVVAAGAALLVGAKTAVAVFGIKALADCHAAIDRALWPSAEPACAS